MDRDVRVDTGKRWYSVQREDFKLSCDNIGDVSAHHTCVPFILYAIYRLIFAVYFVITVIYFGVAGSDWLAAKFLIYLTDWTYIVMSFYQCVACVNAVLDGRKRHRNDSKEERLRYQIQWLCLNVCAAVSVIVTLVYWTALRPLMEDKLPIFLDISIHLLPGIICLIDVTITAVVIRFVHVVYPLVYLFVYLVFAIIYWAAGGTDALGNPSIYPILDFGNAPGIAVASVVSICLVTLVAQAALKGLCLLRMRCLERHKRRSSDETEPRNHTGHHALDDLEIEVDTENGGI